MGLFLGTRNSEKSPGLQTIETAEEFEENSANSQFQDSFAPTSPVERDTISSHSEIDFSLPTGELLAHTRSIADALYLRNLIYHWMAGDPGISDEEREAFLAGAISKIQKQAFGFETEIFYQVSRLADSSIRDAWKDNYANHLGRSEIYSTFMQRDLLKGSPESLFLNSLQWNPWERARYNDDVISAWAKKEPNRAFAWYEFHPADFGVDAKQGVLDVWAAEDFEGLSAHMISIGNPESRNAAIEAIATHMAFEGTDQALDWANSLGLPADQELAHDKIYQKTPRGIGAVLKLEDGFPLVVTPLVENGLLEGDLIMSATNDGNQSTDFFGGDMTTTIDTLLGEPGSDVSVQIMRLDPETGK